MAGVDGKRFPPACLKKRKSSRHPSTLTLAPIKIHRLRGPPMEELPLPKVYQLIELGPAVLLTTAAKGGFNVMTMSRHMMVDFIPPLVACIVCTANHSFAALRSTGECVIEGPCAEQC
jgi:Flavin reductase like domain